jgi:hypothetical protein
MKMWMQVWKRPVVRVLLLALVVSLWTPRPASALFGAGLFRPFGGFFLGPRRFAFRPFGGFFARGGFFRRGRFFF